MPPPTILPLSEIDYSTVLADREAIMKALPHRHEFQLLDAVLLIDIEGRNAFAGYHDVRPDAFWARGHIPGRPLMPGVLMLEVAAQLCSFVYLSVRKSSAFLGFTGLENVKFRGPVEPTARLLIVGRPLQLSPRRLICDMQGFVEGAMTFEARISGMAV